MYRFVKDFEELCEDCAPVYSCSLCGDTPLSHAVDLTNPETAEGRFICLSCAGDNEENIFTCSHCKTNTYKTLEQYAQGDDLCQFCAIPCNNCGQPNYRSDKDLCYVCESKIELGYPIDWIPCGMPRCTNFMHEQSLMCDSCLNDVQIDD